MLKAMMLIRFSPFSTLSARAIRFDNAEDTRKKETIDKTISFFFSIEKSMLIKEKKLVEKIFHGVWLAEAANDMREAWQPQSAKAATA